jgi:uncharacterized protein (TIGR02246 family)
MVEAALSSASSATTSLGAVPPRILAASAQFRAGGEPKEEIAAAIDRWASLFDGGDPDQILALYAPDAILWGTLSPSIRQGAQELREYFVAAFRALPGHRVSFGDQHIRVYGTTAINTGDYTFSYVKDGETKTIPARYSLVFVRTDGGWLIVDHHSSTMPSASLLGPRR